MPQSNRRGPLKIPFRPLDGKKKSSHKRDLLLPKSKGVKSTKSSIPSFGDPIKSIQPESLPGKVFGSKSKTTKIVGEIPSKSKTRVSSGKLPVKSSHIITSKLPKQATSLLSKRVKNPQMVTHDLIQKEHVAGRFLSLMIVKGKLIRNKATSAILGRKFLKNAEANRLSHFKRLQLFRTLSKEPLPLLELHGRLGVSKQSIKRLVKNGLLMEVWGPKAVGLRFELTKKGKKYLKELEAAASYEPMVRENALLRLKNRTSL